MPVETRRSNKDAHPGLPDLEPKQKRRTSEQVQAAQAAKDAQKAAQAAKATDDANRIAYYEQEIRRIQEQAALTANHPLSSLTSDVAEPPKGKVKSAKPKSVSAKKKTTNAPSPVTEHPMDVDTEVEEAEPPKPPTQGKRKKVKGATREDIENVKKLEKSVGGAPTSGGAGGSKPMEKAGGSKEQHLEK